MCHDAGDQRTCGIEHRREHKTHPKGAQYLAEIRYKCHAAAVEEVKDMPQSEGQTGNKKCRFYALFFDGLKKAASEKKLLQKTDCKHTCNIESRVNCRKIHPKAIPKVSGCNHHQGKKIECIPEASLYGA